METINTDEGNVVSYKELFDEIYEDFQNIVRITRLPEFVDDYNKLPGNCWGDIFLCYCWR